MMSTHPLVEEFRKLLTEIDSESWLSARGPGDRGELDADLAACGRTLAADAQLWFERFGADPIAVTFGPSGFTPTSLRSVMEGRHALRGLDTSNAYRSRAFVPVMEDQWGNAIVVHAPLANLGPALISWAFFYRQDSLRATSFNSLWSAVVNVIWPHPNPLRIPVDMR